MAKKKNLKTIEIDATKITLSGIKKKGADATLAEQMAAYALSDALLVELEQSLKEIKATRDLFASKIEGVKYEEHLQNLHAKGEIDIHMGETPVFKIALEDGKTVNLTIAPYQKSSVEVDKSLSSAATLATMPSAYVTAVTKNTLNKTRLLNDYADGTLPANLRAQCTEVEIDGTKIKEVK